MAYAIFELAQGLLIHPYQTMQELAQEKIFFWLALLPGMLLGSAVLIWRVALVPLVQLFFCCQVTPIWGCNLISFLANWLIFFCIYWQILLLYLFVRFSEVLPRA